MSEIPTTPTNKRRPTMRVGQDPARAKDEPAYRCRIQPVARESAIDRLLLLLERDRAASAAAGVSKPPEIDLAAASAALGYEIRPEHVRDRAMTTLAWRARLAKLLEAPGVTQRTPEWYEARKTMVTASDVAQALGCSKFGNQRTFFQKKCGAPEEQAAFDASLPPLKWGVMYEPVAQAIYSAVNLGVRVHEFGLLRHETLSFVGASPDGISDLGVMLEIKCPWRRRIVEGEVPMQYYYQIQAQLAVCGLQECDYFECEFFEADDSTDEAWLTRTDAWHERGVFAEILGWGASPPRPPSLSHPGDATGMSGDAINPGDVGDAAGNPGDVGDAINAGNAGNPGDAAGNPGNPGDAKGGGSGGTCPPPPTFEYPPNMFATAEEHEAWIAGVRAKHGEQNVRAHWWVLRRQAASRVHYDAAFSDDMFKRLATVWNRTLEYRGDRERYLVEVGAAAPPSASSSEARTKLETDADAVVKFAGACAFLDE